MTDRKFYYLIIDASNLFYRVALDKIDVRNISQLYNDVVANPVIDFFDRIKNLHSRFGYDTSEIYLLFDNPGSVFFKRREIDSSYKHNREKTKLNSLFLSVINFIRLIALSYSDYYRVIHINGYEADDIVKPLIDYLNLNFYRNCLLVSNDLDWSRCISDHVYWYNYKRVYDKISFREKYGFYPDENKIIFWKSLVGDASDCIEPGLKNVSRNMIQYILEKYNSVDDLIVRCSNDPNINLHWRDKIKESVDRLRLNEQLVGFIPLRSHIRNYIKYGKLDEKSLNLFFAVLNRETNVKEFFSVTDDTFFASPLVI